MKMIFSLEECLDLPRTRVGGKGAWLTWLQRLGMKLPRTLCLPVEGYFAFLEHGRLGEKLAMELHRKPFADMRWEEIWDVSLRIRNLFLRTPLPPQLEEELARGIAEVFGSGALAIRSSAPAEDQAEASFAGLHDSVVNVRGREEIGTAIRKVWASLWSDRALLYRKELSLEPEQSGMALIIQELVAGEVSGICFTRDPLEEEKMVIEAVYGLNQGLVDGEIAPDRWLIAPEEVESRLHTAPSQPRRRLVASGGTVRQEEVPAGLADKPPLDEDHLASLSDAMETLHRQAGRPLDIEWTMLGGILHLLQARPVTARRREGEGDRRSWYLSLHRSLENLLALRKVIEEEMLPAMAREAEAFASHPPDALHDVALAGEIRRRQERSEHWTRRYWRDCIPFAHGVRLFGEIYNETMRPDDPHEFVRLLQGESMLSVSRNSLVGRLARMLRDDPRLAQRLARAPGGATGDSRFDEGLAELAERHGSYFAAAAREETERELFARILLTYARSEERPKLSAGADRTALEARFLADLAAARPQFDGRALLELARASYRLRDDDNIYLGRIEEQAARAVREGRRRLQAQGRAVETGASAEEIAALLAGQAQPPSGGRKAPRRSSPGHVRQRSRARQLVGQPASAGVARGVARVVRQPREIADFQEGEILVVESIEPTMTFFAPLAAAIVEERGGMLIHGAIIAREYGIPCVTGVARASERINNGDILTVDGYLGLVTSDRPL